MGSLPSTANGLTSPIAVQRNGEKPADLNVRNVVLGDILFKTWYPSFYPEELVSREVDRLHVCQWCFKYTPEIMKFSAHCVCILQVSMFAGRTCRLTRATVQESLLIER